MATSATFKQLQFVGFGVATSWYLDTFSKLNEILERHSAYSTPWLATSFALGCAAVSTLCFLYVLVYLPRIKQVKVDYHQWQESELKWAVPILSTSLITGWNVFLYVLWQYSPLSLLWSAIADLGLYTLSFGILGLIPRSSLSITHRQRSS